MGKYSLYLQFFAWMMIYIVVRFIRVHYDVSPFVKFHLTDLLFVPAMASFALIFVRILKRDHNILLHPVLVFAQAVVVALFFEWYLPNYSWKAHTYTSDPMDVLMYFMGAAIFILLQYFNRFYSVTSRVKQ